MKIMKKKFPASPIMLLLSGTLLSTQVWTQQAVAATVTTTIKDHGHSFDGITVDKDNYIYASNPAADKIIQFSPDGTASDFTSDQQFSNIVDMIPDGFGGLLLTEFDNNSILQASDTGSAVVLGAAMGPNDIVKDSNGNIYVASSKSGQIDKLTPAGEVTSLAKLTSAVGLAIDENDNLFAAASNGDIYSVSSEGSLQKIASLSTQIWHLEYAVDTLFAAGFKSHKIYKILPDGSKACAVAGSGGAASVDGDISDDSVSFNKPLDLVAKVDGSGLYISEKDNIRLLEFDGSPAELACKITVTPPPPPPPPPTKGGGSTGFGFLGLLILTLFRRRA